MFDKKDDLDWLVFDNLKSMYLYFKICDMIYAIETLR